MPFQWPWRSETRSSGSYTDAVVASIVARAGGTTAADARSTAAVEMAAGIWGRAMGAASVTPATAATAALTPAILQMAGRQAIRDGGSLFAISVDDAGRVQLLPCWSHDVRGGADPDSWVWRCALSGPSTTTTTTVANAGVVWLPWAVDPDRSWIGRGPMDYASSTATLAGNLEQRLGEEAGGPVGSVIPVPSDGGDGTDGDNLAQLKADLRASRGGVSLVETSAAGWGEGRGAAPQRDWKQVRFGAEPPETLRGLRTDVYEAVCMATGIPPGLAARSDGTLAREGWRQFVMGAVEPVARVWAVEIANKLNAPGLVFDFKSLWAHDLIGRSQALKRMVDAGVPLADAASASGILTGDDS